MKPFLVFLLLVSVCRISAQDNSTAFLVEKFPDLSSSASISDIHFAEGASLWVCSSEGVFEIVSYDQKKVVKFDFPASAAATDKLNRTWTTDTEGRLWLKGNPDPIILEDLKEDKQINDMLAHKGKLYLSSAQGLLKIDADETHRQQQFDSGNSKLSNDVVNFCFADPEGILWVGTNAGLVRIKDDNWKVWEKRSKFYAATHTKEGTWLASDSELWLVDKFNRWYPAAVDKMLSRGEVRALAADSKGRVFIASEILVRYDPYAGEIIRLDEDAGFFETKVSDLAVDQEDNVWVASTNQGLFRVRFGVSGPQQLLAVASVQQGISCFGNSEASIQVQVTGGREPYMLNWSDPALKGTNANRLSAGDYSLTVYDALGDSVVLGQQISEPEPVKVQILKAERISEAGLRDGKAEVAGIGGTGPYLYQWSTGASDAAIRRLDKGNYQVTVTDQNNCLAMAEVEILKEPAMPALVSKVFEEGEALQINELYFDADSARINSRSYPALDEIFDFLSRNPEMIAEIGGHTNDLPPDDYCDSLSTARAKVVAEYLYGKGVSFEQLKYKGYGKRNPIASNKTEAGRKRNQRVELKIIRLEED